MSWGSGWWRAWRSLRRDWPAKVGAVAAALIVWWVASSDPASTAQRSLLVPLEVVGAAADEVAVGVPARVEVVISGPGDRMDRLRADDVDAVLDLEGVDGEFARDVEARVPTALRLIRVVPGEVIGRLEAVRALQFEVVPYLAPLAEGIVPSSVSIEPATVTVEARDPVLEIVDAVLAPFDGGVDGASRAVLVPVDADGRPVAEARVVPETARVTVETTAIRQRAVRPIALAPPDDPRLAVEAVTPSQLALVGPADLLADIDAVAAEVPDATASLPVGRYDLPVRLALPDGVAAEDGVVATIRVRAADEVAPGAEAAP